MKDVECISCEHVLERKYDKPKGVLCLHFKPRKDKEQNGKN